MTVGAICAALGLDINPRQMRDLQRYAELLLRWNSTFNLTAIRSEEGVLIQHVADCLAAVAAIAQCGGRLVDVGSGAGLPGAVIAIVRPDIDVTCVDSVGKKTAFVRQVAGSLSLSNLHAVHANVETLTRPTYDIATCRAFASLREFVLGSQGAVRPTGLWLAMKGKRPDSEVSDLPPSIDVFHVERLTVPLLQAERCLVWMRRKPDDIGTR